MQNLRELLVGRRGEAALVPLHSAQPQTGISPEGRWWFASIELCERPSCPPDLQTTEDDTKVAAR